MLDGAATTHQEPLDTEDLRNAFTNSALVYWLGHIHFDQGDPMQSYLSLLDREAPKSPQRRFTAAEISNLEILRPLLVLLIGCASGASFITPNDDQLGLSSAMFIAGVASIITTMWPIDPKDGIQFVEAFLTAARDIQQEQETSDVGSSTFDYLQLPKVMQRAILSLRARAEESGRKAPYHWASFTLNGAWLSPLIPFHK